eukprot:TRINITY_DN9341_c0_g1_i1.p1 TRINITY_DN9341_c0_g1~~TRINITY_DN9341_c0_g1_i1.p1  ORF type:complete len:202 (-),score=40.07 TRINITY_DN9341_c0_g1_i1:49-654(-)
MDLLDQSKIAEKAKNYVIERSEDGLLPAVRLGGLFLIRWISNQSVPPQGEIRSPENLKEDIQKHLRNNSRNLEFLVLEKTGGRNDFPKGHQEQGESVEQTAVRELREETGIEPSDVIILPGFSFYVTTKTISSSLGKVQAEKKMTFLLGIMKEGKENLPIKLCHEHVSYEWRQWKSSTTMPEEHWCRLLNAVNNWLSGSQL